MRLWTLHPKYLDARGLCAAWREALLAQAVLRGRARGYRRHPQLARFRATASPRRFIGAYLWVIYREGVRRGYSFDRGKLPRGRSRADLLAPRMTATRGQLDCEWRHLQAKLFRRERVRWARQRVLVRPNAHPLFRIVPGPVAAWERGDERIAPAAADSPLGASSRPNRRARPRVAAAAVPPRRVAARARACADIASRHRSPTRSRWRRT